MAGLAQKGGAVASHIRFSNHPEDIHAIRVAARGADLVIGGDMVVAGSKKVLAAVKPGTTTMVINTAEMLPGEFTRNPEFSLPTRADQAYHRGARGSGPQPFRQCVAACHRAARPIDRRQSVHARLRLPAWRPAGVG